MSKHKQPASEAYQTLYAFDKHTEIKAAWLSLE